MKCQVISWTSLYFHDITTLLGYDMILLVHVFVANVFMADMRKLYNRLRNKYKNKTVTVIAFFIFRILKKYMCPFRVKKKSICAPSLIGRLENKDSVLSVCFKIINTLIESIMLVIVLNISLRSIVSIILTSWKLNHTIKWCT